MPPFAPVSRPATPPLWRRRRRNGRVSTPRLELEGFDQALVLLAVFADRDAYQGQGLGRRTMPETLAYAAVIAVHTFRLAARVRGRGGGWASILDPEQVDAALDVPSSWRLVA